MTAASTYAQVIRSYGDETRFEAATLALSGVVGPHDVRIAVAAVSVNPVDLSTRAGKNIPVESAVFPMVLGWDVAGTVTSIGEEVAGIAVGDRVAAMTFQPADQNGTYRSTLDLDADLVVAIPDELDLPTAATVPLVGLTAAQTVARSGVSQGSTVLVNAPLGAVGRLVVQLAAARGAHVVALAAAARADEARALGAQTVLAREATSEDVLARLEGPLDAAVDMIGGGSARNAFAAVRDGGTYVTTVPPYIDPTGVFDAERGVDVALIVVHPDHDELAALLALVARGSLVSPIGATFALTDVAEAHRRQAGGGLRGKLVLVP